MRKIILHLQHGNLCEIVRYGLAPGPYVVDNSGKLVVERLIQPISGSRRNVTVDNWFLSISLAKDLLQNYQQTLDGTLKQNKREIPPLLSHTKNRPRFSSIFAFRPECILVSYKSKRNKIVLALSYAFK